MRLKVFEIQNKKPKNNQKHNKMLSNEYSPTIFDAETKRYSTFLEENKFEENIARNIQNSIENKGIEQKNKRTSRILNIILIVVVIVAIVIICV